MIFKYQFIKLSAREKRKEILGEAIRCVTRGRNTEHGEPEDNFKAIADLWNSYLNNKTEEIDAKDVACMMALFKIGRMLTGKENIDNYVDCAGYIACAAGITRSVENEQGTAEKTEKEPLEKQDNHRRRKTDRENNGPNNDKFGTQQNC